MQREPKYPDRSFTLKNKLGNILHITLRLYHPGDEEGMIACIREEYGNTYFKRDFYKPAYLAKKAREGVITFLIAETMEDGIAGMLLLKEFYPEESMCEIASQIFRKKYRGYGLAEPFFTYAMEILKTRSYSAAFCLPVLFHNVTQRLLYRQGLHATGFLLNVFDLRKTTHSYNNGRNTKHSQGIQIMPLEKRNAGILYLPPEHMDFCREIYEQLDVDYCMAHVGKPIKTSQKEIKIQRDRKDMPDQSDITWENNMAQASFEIRIHEIGRDLHRCMMIFKACFSLEERQTANVLLNINDPHAVWAYDMLEGIGYFFCGLKPLCSEREYMVLHYPGKVEIYFEDYVVSEEFAPLLSYIKRKYEAKK